MKIELASYFSAIMILVITINLHFSLNNINPLIYGMDTNNYPTVENKTKLFLEKLQQSGGPPLYTLTPTEARNVLSGLQAGPIEKLLAEIENKTLPGGPNGEISIQIVRPQR
jgi:hypothetical protein